MKHVMAAHSVTKCRKDMIETDIKIYSNATDYKLQLSSKSIVKPHQDIMARGAR